MIVGLTSVARVNPYATLLIDELARHGVPAAFVLSAERGLLGDLRERLGRRGWSGAARALRRRAGSAGTGSSPLAGLAHERGLDPGAPLGRVCEQAGVEVARVPDLASPEATEAVKTRRADVLINAGGGLFRASLLAAPARGILNAHMARLPDLRGVDVLEWSVLLGVEIGVSVHWIDAGIDTGGVLAFEVLTPSAGDTLESLREKAMGLSARMLAEQVAGLEQGRETVQPPAPAGPQLFALHPRLRALAAGRLTRHTEES